MNLINKKSNGIKIFLRTIFLATVLFSIVFFLVSCSKEQIPDEKKQNTVVVLETSSGIIEIELYSDNSPETVKNFLEYVKSGHYENTIFHRVIPNFMIQGGGYTKDAEQKPTLPPIKLESNNNLSNLRGTIAMARTNVPDSATSQFFINTVDNKFLDYSARPGGEGYAVFGIVVAGMDVVDSISSVQTGSSPVRDWPITPVIINKVYIKK